MFSIWIDKHNITVVHNTTPINNSCETSESYRVVAIWCDTSTMARPNDHKPKLANSLKIIFILNLPKVINKYYIININTNINNVKHYLTNITK